MTNPYASPSGGALAALGRGGAAGDDLTLAVWNRVAESDRGLDPGHGCSRGEVEAGAVRWAGWVLRAWG
jgi:hypothetical protein